MISIISSSSSSYSSTSSSPNLFNFNQQQQQRSFHIPKSRSKLHHQIHQHHHHQPSWSSSLSAFSLPRSSAFLIDEYGNEHDPEHCQFKTLAVSAKSRSSSSSSSPSSHSHSSNRSSIRSCTPSHIAQSISIPSCRIPSAPLQIQHKPLPSNYTWSTIKTRQHKKLKNSSAPLQNFPMHEQQSNHHSGWTGKIWSHLRRPSSTSTCHPTHSIRSNRPSLTPRSINPIHNFTFKNQSNHSTCLFKRKRKLSMTGNDHLQNFHTRSDTLISNHHPIRSGHQNLCGMRKRLELVKLEFRFGILRTRKRINGVWKK